MSYPDPRYPDVRYDGQGGETSAWLRSAEHPPEIDGPAAGQSAHYLATGATTGGDFGLYRWNMGPGPSGPAPHFHRTMSESFFVLDGTVRLYDGQRWLDAGAGDFLHVPPGGVHGFRNESGSSASMLILFTPGAPREAYFEGLAAVAAGRRTMTDEERLAFLEAHDNHVV